MNRVPDGFTFKLSDRAPPDKVALAEGGTVLFETRSVDTVGGTTAFDLTRPETAITLALAREKKEHFVRPVLSLNLQRLLVYISLSVRVSSLICVRAFPRN